MPGGGLWQWQVLLDGIVKRYRIGRGHPPLRAVDGVWLGIGRGECFGLLGASRQRILFFQSISQALLARHLSACLGPSSLATSVLVFCALGYFLQHKHAELQLL